MYKVNIKADSINKLADRITTMEITFPRMVLAEFNTHRMFSRNSASSRAIPFKKMVKAVKDNPFVPLAWQKDHSGMQGTEYITDETALLIRKAQWLKACESAVEHAEALNSPIEMYAGMTRSSVDRVEMKTPEYGGITKQLCNRLLEPFMWHTVLVTATEWQNFFALRNHPAADIHIQKIAEMMLDAYNASTPKYLYPGEWHIPYEDDISKANLVDALAEIDPSATINTKAMLQGLLKVATGMAAGVSYTIADAQGAVEYANNISVYKKLIDRTFGLSENGHWSPFEHCAECPTDDEYQSNIRGYANYDRQDGIEIWDVEPAAKGWFGNFRGWKQYRKTFENENRTDDRVIMKPICIGPDIPIPGSIEYVSPKSAPDPLLDEFETF